MWWSFRGAGRYHSCHYFHCFDIIILTNKLQPRSVRLQANSQGGRCCRKVARRCTNMSCCSLLCTKVRIYMYSIVSNSALCVFTGCYFIFNFCSSCNSGSRNVRTKPWINEPRRKIKLVSMNWSAYSALDLEMTSIEFWMRYVNI